MDNIGNWIHLSHKKNSNCTQVLDPRIKRSWTKYSPITHMFFQKQMQKLLFLSVQRPFPLPLNCHWIFLGTLCERNSCPFSPITGRNGLVSASVLTAPDPIPPAGARNWPLIVYLYIMIFLWKFEKSNRFKFTSNY